MKKILYITTLNRTINSFLVPHIEMLISKGHLVDCACSIDEKVDEILTNSDVRIFHIPFTRNPLDPANIKAFKELIKIQTRNQYDIVHVHTPIAALYGRLLKVKFPHLKTIYTVHGFHFYRGAPFLNWWIYYPIEKMMANYTDTIITMNHEDYEAAKKFKVEETFKVNGVGVNIAAHRSNLFNQLEIRRKLNLTKDDFVIIMIAEVNKNKNHKQMIDAVEILKKKGINVKVICAGDGPLLKNLERVIANKNLSDNIHLLGFRSDINELISVCDIGILLSYREGLPRNIMELMSSKKPVIGTNIRGINDLVVDGVTGFLVKVSDANETAEKIEVLYNNRKLVEEMGCNAYESIKSYDVEQVIKNLAKVYV